MEQREIILQNININTSESQEKSTGSCIRILASSTAEQERWELEQLLRKSDHEVFQDKNIILFYDDKPFDIEKACDSIENLDYVVFPEEPTDKELQEKARCFEYACRRKHPKLKIIDRKTVSKEMHKLHLCLHPCFLELPITTSQSRNLYINSSELADVKIFIASASEDTRDEIIRYMASKNTKHDKVLISYTDVPLDPEDRKKIISSSTIVIYPEDYDRIQKEEDIQFCIKQDNNISIRTFIRDEKQNIHNLKASKEYKNRRELYRHRNDIEIIKQYDIGPDKLSYAPIQIDSPEDVAEYCEFERIRNLRKAYISTNDKDSRDTVMDFIRANISDFSDYLIAYSTSEITEEDRHAILQESDLIIYTKSEIKVSNRDQDYLKIIRAPLQNKLKILKKKNEEFILQDKVDTAPQYIKNYYSKDGDLLFIPTGANLDTDGIIKCLENLSFSQIDQTPHDQDMKNIKYELRKIRFYLLPLTKSLLEKPDSNYNIFINDIQIMEKDPESTTRIIPINTQDLSSAEWDKMMDLYGEKIGHPQLLDFTRTQDIKPPQMFQTLLAEALSTKTNSDEKEQQEIDAAFSYKIFISYRQKDRLLARALMKRIHEEKDLEDVAFWYDQELKAGKDFELQIKQAMCEADLVLMLVTDNMLEYTSTRTNADNKEEQGNYVSFTEYPMMGTMKDGQKVIPVAFYLTTGIFENAKKNSVKSMAKQFSISFFSNKNENRFNSMFPSRAGVDELITDADTLIARIRKYRKEALLQKQAPDVARQKYALSKFYQKGLRTDMDFEKATRLLEESAKMTADIGFEVEVKERLLSIYENGINSIEDYRNAPKACMTLISLLKQLTDILMNDTYCTETLLQNNWSYRKDTKTAIDVWTEKLKAAGFASWKESPRDVVLREEWFKYRLTHVPSIEFPEGQSYLDDGRTIFQDSIDNWYENVGRKYTGTEHANDKIETVLFDATNNYIITGYIKDLDYDRMKESFCNRIAIIEKIHDFIDNSVQILNNSKTDNNEELEKAARKAYALAKNHIFSMLAVLLGLRTNTPLEEIINNDLLAECLQGNKACFCYYHTLYDDDDLCILWLTLKTLHYKYKRLEFRYGKLTPKAKTSISISMWNMLDSMKKLLEESDTTIIAKLKTADKPIYEAINSMTVSSPLKLESKTYNTIRDAWENKNNDREIFNFKLKKTLSRLSEQNYNYSINIDKKNKESVKSYLENAINYSNDAYKDYKYIKEKDHSSITPMEVSKLLCFKLYLTAAYASNLDPEIYKTIETFAWKSYESITHMEDQDKYTGEYLNIIDILLAPLANYQIRNPYDQKQYNPLQKNALYKANLEPILKTIERHINSIITAYPSATNIQAINRINSYIKKYAINTTISDQVLRKTRIINDKQKTYLMKIVKYKQLTDSHNGMLSEEICSRTSELCLDLMEESNKLTCSISPYDLFKTLEYSISVLATSSDEDKTNQYEKSLKERYISTKEKWISYKDNVVKCKREIERLKETIIKAEARYKTTLFTRLLNSLKDSFKKNEWYNQDAFSIASKVSELLKSMHSAPCTSENYASFVEILCIPYLNDSDNNNATLIEYIEQTFEELKDAVNKNPDLTLPYRKQSAFFASLTYALIDSDYSSNFPAIKDQLIRYCYCLCRFCDMSREQIAESMPELSADSHILEHIYDIEMAKDPINDIEPQFIHEAYYSRYSSDVFRRSVRNAIETFHSNNAEKLFCLFEDDLELQCTKAYSANRERCKDIGLSNLLNTSGIETDLKNMIIKDIWEGCYKDPQNQATDRKFTLIHYGKVSGPYLEKPITAIKDIDRISNKLDNSTIESLKSALDSLAHRKMILHMLPEENRKDFKETECIIDKILKEFCPIMLYNHKEIYSSCPELLTPDITEENIVSKQDSIKKTIEVWTLLSTVLLNQSYKPAKSLEIYMPDSYLHEMKRAMQAISVLYDLITIKPKWQTIHINTFMYDNMDYVFKVDNTPITLQEYSPIPSSAWGYFNELWRPVIREQMENNELLNISWLPIQRNDAPIRHDSILMVEDVLSLGVITEILKQDQSLKVNLGTKYDLDKEYKKARKAYDQAEKVLVELKKLNACRYLALKAESREIAMNKCIKMQNIPMTMNNKPLDTFAPSPEEFNIDRKSMANLQNKLEQYERYHYYKWNKYHKAIESTPDLFDNKISRPVSYGKGQKLIIRYSRYKYYPQF